MFISFSLHFEKVTVKISLSRLEIWRRENNILYKYEALQKAVTNGRTSGNVESLAH